MSAIDVKLNVFEGPLDLLLHLIDSALQSIHLIFHLHVFLVHIIAMPALPRDALPLHFLRVLPLRQALPLTLARARHHGMALHFIAVDGRGRLGLGLVDPTRHLHEILLEDV